MSQYIKLLMGFLCCLWGIPQDRIPENEPKLFAMGQEYDQASISEEVFAWQGADSTVQHRLELLSDSLGRPLLFYSNINTPVCIDGLCKPLYIEIYWNLIGNYVGYGVFSRELPTKFDHELFEETDYLKLHHLLQDRHSILGRRKLSGLFDADVKPEKKVKYKGEEVDAVSGATKKEIKESVVEGALYSCYTLWHLVHGEARRNITAWIDSVYSPDLARYFLYSDYEDYQYYALREMDSLTLDQSLPRITEIFGQAKPLTRTYLLKKMPESMWHQPKLSTPLYQQFSAVDVNSQTLLIHHLEDAGAEAATILADQIASMTKNHLKIYLAYLSRHPERLSPAIKSKLLSVVQEKQYAYGYLISSFLNKF